MTGEISSDQQVDLGNLSFGTEQDNSDIPYCKNTTKEVLHQILNADWDVEHEFIVRNGHALDFVSRVRTELSRARNKVKALNKKPAKFKLIHVKTEMIYDCKAEKVVIKKTKGNSELIKGIADIFDKLV